MAGVLFLIFLAGIASAEATLSLESVRQADADVTSSSNITLSPVTAPSTDEISATPSVNISLPYGIDLSTNSVINLGLTTSHASVLLEAITSVISVDCSTDSVSVMFDNADDLDSSYNEWSSHPLLVLVTNHMGDCDTEVERGFFTADSFTTDTSTLTLIATTQKPSINDVGSYLRANFSGFPILSYNSKAKRGLGSITYSPDPINFSTDLVLNETILFEADPYFTATLDSGYLDVSVTVGGFVTYNILTSTLEELQVYLETNTTSDLILDLDVYVLYNTTFSYIEAIETYTVDIPGVLSFGPEISFEIGAEIAADAGVDIILDLCSGINNGTFTLDYVSNLTYTGSWDPAFNISVSVSEEATVEVTPYVTTTFTLDFEILGGEYNASGGISPTVKFPTEISLAAEQDAGKRSEIIVRDMGIAGCENGVQVDSDFDFSLYAFVTGKWDDDYLYNVSLTILDQCLFWA